MYDPGFGILISNSHTGSAKEFPVDEHVWNKLLGSLSYLGYVLLFFTRVWSNFGKYIQF